MGGFFSTVKRVIGIVFSGEEHHILQGTEDLVSPLHHKLILKGAKKYKNHKSISVRSEEIVDLFGFKGHMEKRMAKKTKKYILYRIDTLTKYRDEEGKIRTEASHQGALDVGFLEKYSLKVKKRIIGGKTKAGTRISDYADRPNIILEKVELVGYYFPIGHLNDLIKIKIKKALKYFPDIRLRQLN